MLASSKEVAKNCSSVSSSSPFIVVDEPELARVAVAAQRVEVEREVAAAPLLPHARREPGADALDQHALEEQRRAGERLGRRHLVPSIPPHEPRKPRRESVRFQPEEQGGACRRRVSDSVRSRLRPRPPSGAKASGLGMERAARARAHLEGVAVEVKVERAARCELPRAARAQQVDHARERARINERGDGRLEHSLEPRLNRVELVQARADAEEVKVAVVADVVDDDLLRALGLRVRLAQAAPDRHAPRRRPYVRVRAVERRLGRRREARVSSVVAALVYEMSRPIP